MRTRPLLAFAPFGLVLLTACGAFRSGSGSSEGGGISRQDGAVVLTGVALRDGQGDLLSAMRGKVPNLRVRRIPRDCPQITLRNAASIQSIVNPRVFVDGTGTSDTCILESLRAIDIERVEVYPTGVTKRPGYGRHAHGLILVFMRSALSDGTDRRNSRRMAEAGLAARP